MAGRGESGIKGIWKKLRPRTEMNGDKTRPRFFKDQHEEEAHFTFLFYSSMTFVDKETGGWRNNLCQRHKGVTKIIINQKK